MRRHHVAVVGAGPSGLYAAAALLAGSADVAVTVLDRLPAPYGLVRYGVAPDHEKMKSVSAVLARPFAAPAHPDAGPAVEFLGGVPIGADGVGAGQLRRHVHAVVHATGAGVDRRLGIAGEDLPGSVGSAEVVAWYSGHPEIGTVAPRLDTPAVAVIGAGNVALDLARVLARPAEDLAGTDVPQPVLDALRASAVREVHVLIRRGPEHVRFTPPELRRLGELPGVGVLVHGLSAHPSGAEPADRRTRQNLAVLTGWAQADPAATHAAPRRVHLHFWSSPTALIATAGRVGAVAVAATAPDPDGRVRATGALTTLPVGLVVRAIGYTATPVAGLPFDPVTGTVPHRAGRVIGPDGRVVGGAYVTGWLKRGPVGVIGTNKADAAETVESVLADLPTLTPPPQPGPVALRAGLTAAGIDPVDWSGWLRLDAEEVRRGGLRSAQRVKVAVLAEMLEHGRTRPG